jgi:hypothetical protein
MKRGPIQDRVRAAGIVIVDRLSPTDFASSEDREFFHQIQTAFADAPSCEADPSSGVAGQMTDATAEGIASDILDLRDATMGRAIRNARTTRRAAPPGRSRR